ncbi:MAG: Lrp/AsnC family transcriptional regulator [Promethearchaeota archaeon]
MEREFVMIASIDETDRGILEYLQKNARLTNKQIAKYLGLPKSTVQYRIKRLEAEGIIKGYRAQIDVKRIGKDYPTFTFIRTKHAMKKYKKVGKLLSEIPGVSKVYFMAGDYDFIVFSLSYDRKDFMQKLEKIYDIEEVERTNTIIILRTIKDEAKIDLSEQSRGLI